MHLARENLVTSACTDREKIMYQNNAYSAARRISSLVSTIIQRRDPADRDVETDIVLRPQPLCPYQVRLSRLLNSTQPFERADWIETEHSVGPVTLYGP